MKNSVIILSLMMLFFGCENLAVLPDEVGTVEGKVTISPLCGTIQAGATGSNPCGFTDAQLDAVYSRYKVAIKGEVSGKIVSNEFVLNKTGAFTFEVPVGTYKVEVIVPEGSSNQSLILGNSNNSVKEVSVLKNQVTKIDLSVDTGIR